MHLNHSPNALVRLTQQLVDTLSHLPHSLTALLARFSIAAVFWQSGQTKIQGFAINLVDGTFELGMPSLAPFTLALFADEYQVPLLPVELAAYMATVAEHLFPILILLGLATRFSSLALLGMTLVIQVFVYPGAYATHGVWAAVLLWLISRGPGVLAIDHLIARRFQ
ncbi:DoxX family protein [Atopomonas sediminilitoris]|uniref:DoxX family protein n=1 Tax=Atopomonas sediminilitoris TaxID=2919919 RepID=UPI001F4E5566|nr:DoxX family protein [Atopomonas sediminilitoris]MCJ8169069.1 DoxX family protein [Atopomonas sediminilitoris]